MKFTKIVGISIATLIFSGCGKPSVPLNVETSKPLVPLNEREKTIEYRKIGVYYYVPANSTGRVLDKKWAYVNNILTSSSLQCTENDLLQIAYGIKKNEKDNAKYSYLSILTEAEKEALNTNPTYIPRRDSKEFNELIRINTELARTGQMICISPMTKKELRKHKNFLQEIATLKRDKKIEAKRRAEQEKIDKDPRVISARIQAEAIRESARIQAEATKEAAYKERQQQRMQNYSQNIQNIMDKSDRRIQMHQLGYTLTH